MAAAVPSVRMQKWTGRSSGSLAARTLHRRSFIRDRWACGFVPGPLVIFRGMVETLVFRLPYTFLKRCIPGHSKHVFQIPWLLPLRDKVRNKQKFRTLLFWVLSCNTVMTYKKSLTIFPWKCIMPIVSLDLVCWNSKGDTTNVRTFFLKEILILFGGIFFSHELAPVQLNIRCRQFICEALPWVWQCPQKWAMSYPILTLRKLFIQYGR